MTPPQPQPPAGDPFWLAALKKWKLWTPILVALLAAVGIGLTVTDEDGDGVPDVVVIHIGQAQNDPAARTPVTAPDGKSSEDRQVGDPKKPIGGPVTVDPDKSSNNEPAQSHEDQVDEFPSGVPQAEAEKGVQQKTAPGKTAPQRVGGAENYSCRLKEVRNQSSRAGQEVLLAVLHYTVSRNVAGWGDVNAIWGLFNTPSFAASSTFIIDFEGNCLRLMPDSAKPWTQGNFNGRSVSVEIIAMGNETRQQWLDSPLIKDGILSSLWRDTMKRNGLPLRRVNPEGCTVQQAGWTDHNALECGNSHTDVTPNFPYDVFQQQLASGASGNDPEADAEAGRVPGYLTDGEADCATTLIRERAIAQRNGGWGEVAPYHLENAIEAKDCLERANARLHAAADESGWDRLSRRDRHEYIHALI